MTISAPVARVYIVRHGETDENRNRIIQGQLDTQLNADGLAQARRVAEALSREVRFDAAYTSDLARAAVTAEIILKHHPGVPLQRLAQLRERYMGERQGRVWPAPPNPPETTTIERVEALSARALAWWEDSVVSRAGSGPDTSTSTAHVLLVSHGGFIGALVRALLGAGRVRSAEGVDMRGRLVLNTSVTVVDVDAAGLGLLVRYGDVRHLADAGAGAVKENADEMPVGGKSQSAGVVEDQVGAVNQRSRA